MMKKYFEKLKGLLVGVYSDVRLHWKKPAHGNYVSYKEMVNYSVGGMGQQIFIYFIGYFGLGAANTLFGSTIGIRPMHLQTMAVIQQILNVAFLLIRGKMVDNTRTRWGRFRPYMLIASIPLLVLGVSFLFLDFQVMSYNEKMLFVFSFAIAISAISPLFTDTYSELASVITPNTKERAKFYSVTSIIYSFAPTIFYALIPILSNLTGGYTKIDTYRYVIAPFAVIGFFLNLFVVFGTKEKVITSRTYVQKTSIFKSCLQIFKNKYWWIRTLAGSLGFLESAFNAIFLWTFMYGAQDMTTYAFLVTVQGSASLIAMVSTPFVLKKLGNRGTLLMHNIVNVIFISCMVFTFQVPLLFFFFLYINTIVNQLQIVYSPTMHSEVKDYQQYKSGKRLDFSFGAAGAILMPFTIASGYVIPFVYESLGLTTNYDIMYDPLMRNKLFAVLCVLSVVGAALNLIPYFFYHMTRAKHKVIVDVLHLRAGLENYANGDIDAQGVKAMIEGIHSAEEVLAMEMPNLKEFKQAIKDAKALPKATDEEKLARKEALKLARQNYTKNKEIVEMIEGVNEIYVPEMQKYETELMKVHVAIAENVVSYPIESLVNYDYTLINELRDKYTKIAMERKSHQKDADNSTEALGKDVEQELDSNELAKIITLINKTQKHIVKMIESIRKTYPSGIVTNNREALNAALELPFDTKDLNKIRNAALKLAEREYNTYCKVLAEYMELNSVYKQYQGKQDFHKIEAMFEDAVQEIEERESKIKAEEDAITARRLKELNDLIDRRRAKKQQKHNKNNGADGDDESITNTDEATITDDDINTIDVQDGDSSQAVEVEVEGDNVQDVDVNVDDNSDKEGGAL